MVKNPPANAGDIKHVSSIPGSGRSLEEGIATYSSILACKIPWTEEPGMLQSTGSQNLTQLKQLSAHTQSEVSQREKNKYHILRKMSSLFKGRAGPG